MFVQRYYIISKQPLFSNNQISLAARLTGNTEAGFRWGSTDTRAGNLEQTREDGWFFLGVKVLNAATVMRRGSFVCLKALKANKLRLD